MTPSALYQQKIDTGEICADCIQQQALVELDGLHLAVISFFERSRSLLSWKKPKQPHGLYLWGEVGRGKTFLLDLLYESLPHCRCQRIHFARFMQWLHGQLQLRVGSKNPLQRIAAAYCRQYAVLCFDELYVNDIGDAMLLGEFFAAMYRHGMVFISTSNSHPDDLYKEGLQRSRFLPAIASIHQHNTVYHLGGSHDYRLRMLTENALFYINSDAAQAQQHMRLLFTRLSGNQQLYQEDTVELTARQVAIVVASDEVLWMTFAQMCESARSNFDYIEISTRFKIVMLSHVPKITNDDAARRFVGLIDELYASHTVLVLHSYAQLDQLYNQKKLAFAFQRTISRLIEMQSDAYVALCAIEARLQ